MKPQSIRLRRKGNCKMNRKEYQEMFELRKRINLFETAIAAGYDIDVDEYDRLLHEFSGYIEEYEDDAILMTAEEAEIFRLRYVMGLSFHIIMCTMYKNAKSESTARKKIDRYFRKRP